MREDRNRGARIRERRYDELERNSARNPDPITGQPGSHPVGTGVGTAAGAAAGGAAGAAVGGPVGAGIGIVAGGIAGALTGKSTAETVHPTHEHTAHSDADGWDRYHGYSVIDKDGARIGHLAGAWADRTGQSKYLAVRTGWIFGRTHVVPLQGIRMDKAHRVLVVPYSEAHVKSAPECEPGHSITAPLEEAVGQHYGLHATGDTIARAGSRTGTPEQRTAEHVTIPLAEERIVLGKREVEAGGIRLRKVIRTEIVHQPIELRREEIIIERVAGPEGPPSATNVFNEEVIFVPIHREEPIIAKEARIREEVRVRKTARVEHRDIEEHVRKEDIEVLDSQGAEQHSEEPRLQSPS
jgi:uncharacterized protein (TIGR02271 family)